MSKSNRGGKVQGVLRREGGVLSLKLWSWGKSKK